METKEHEIHTGRESVRRGAEEEQVLLAGLDRRRLLELAGAVRAHESRVRGQISGPRPHDLALYRRLRQIGGGL